jgi:outer membrane receptor protein involved in Fe transport
MFRRYFLLLVALMPGLACAAETTRALPAVEVISNTPLPGLTLSRDLIPAPVQTANDRDLIRGNPLNLADFLNQNLSGVHINETQNNPFQPDVNYRGYSASPLLGTPQGLSVYMDGVRLNQPFGDVVSWDLIPKSAIASAVLMPGSNPLFGLNTLGGALSIQTKDGRSHPGASIMALGGMHARRSLELEYGGFNQNLDWFVTGTWFKEQGWRDDSPSRVAQIFGKVGWRDNTTDVKVAVSHTDNRLHGSALQEFRLLKLDYKSLYTKPDITNNLASMVNIAATHAVNDNVMFSGNMYYRRIDTRTLNADINEGSLDQSVYQPNAAERAALAAAGYAGFPVAGANANNTPFPFWRCIANVLLNDEPGEKCNALINRSSTRQENFGASAQVSAQGTLAGRKHQFTGGAAFDASQVKFNQSSQIGYLNADRSVTPLPAFADGVTGGVVDGAPFDNRVDLSSRTHTWSAYATDTLSLTKDWHLTVSGRYNHTRVVTEDRIMPGGGAGSLDGSHTFNRFNPAAGVVFTPSKAFKAHFSYSEGSRAPSAIELGCADPANPCRLPNSMAGDPPLKQVVAKTVEIGAHGEWANGMKWSTSAFRAENHDDILFVAAPNNTQFGYFRNFGKTRREGLEASLFGKSNALSFGANYTLLNATYQTPELINGASNSSNDSASAGAPGLDGNIRITPGKRIPMIPQHLFKAWVDYAITGQLSTGLAMQAVGSSYARGNENNQHAPDGVTYLGSGKSGGYAVFNWNAQFQADKQLSFFLQVIYVFNRQYDTASQLGPTGFAATGNFAARPLPAIGTDFPLVHSTLYSPGAPRIAWVGMRYRFDPPKPKAE